MPSDWLFHLSHDEVLAIHERLVALFGGLLRVRDLGCRDIAEMPAALFESLLVSCPVHRWQQEGGVLLHILSGRGDPAATASSRGSAGRWTA